MKKLKVTKRIQAKSILATVSLFIVFCVVSTMFWYEGFTKEATQTAEENIKSMMDVSNQNFETSLKDINYIAALLSSEVNSQIKSKVVKWINNDYDNSKDMLDGRRDLQEHMTSLCSFKSYVHGMTIYDFEGHSLGYGISTPTREVVMMEWYEKIKNEEIDVLYLKPHSYSEYHESAKTDQVFTIVRAVKDYGKTIGFVMADVRSQLLDDMYDISRVNGYTILVVDNNSHDIIYQPDEVNQEFAEKLTYGIGSDNRWYFNSANSKNYLVVSQNSKITPWSVIGVVPKDKIIGGFIDVRERMILVLLAGGVLFITLSAFFTHMLTRNLRILTNAVASINGESMQLDIAIKSNDEIRTLYKQIQFMLNRIAELIRNIRSKERAKRKSEIEMLQYQMNPHFLYNTLNTIKVLSVMQGISNVQIVSDALSDMLHLNLDPRKFIFVSEEMEYLNNYLSIQKYRYAGKFEYRIQVDETITSCILPKLIIQPIVENALQHGIAPMKNTGLLQINIYSEEDRLKVVVKDNGVGYDTSVVKVNNNEVNTSHYIGLTNIRTRLDLIFDQAAEMQILSEVGLYTIVEISIPLIHKGEEEKYD